MKLAIIFPKDSEAIFNKNSADTFGGATVQLYQLANELHTVETIDVISLIPEIKEIYFDDHSNFNLIQIYNKTDSFLTKYRKLRSFLLKKKPDFLVQRGLTLFSCLLAIYCRFINISFVYMFAHDIESNGRYQNSRKKCRLFHLLLKYSALLIVQNKLQENNILTQRPGITTIRTLKKGIATEKILPKKDEKYAATWIARCEPWKNIEIFIELVRQNPESHFLAIAPTAKGQEEYFKLVKNQCDKIQNLTFIDFTSNEKVYGYLTRSKIFAITSDSEGDWPMTVLEAAATGVPILSLHLDYGNLFSKHCGGFYCQGDVRLFNDSFTRLKTDNTLYNKMSQGAKNYIKENHNIQNNTSLFVSYLKKFK